MDDQEIRDDLISKASYGEITGEQADAEAERLGLKRFSCKPSDDDFDPNKEFQWSLAMSAAWIAHRSTDAVREHWDKYCTECWHWIWRRWRDGPDGNVYEGWFIEQWSRPTLAMLALGAVVYQASKDGQDLNMTVREAQATLWTALSEGIIEATGIDQQTNRRIAIPANDWHELKPVQGHGDVDEVRYGLLGTGYSALLFPSKAIQNLWARPKEKSLQLPSLMPPEGDGFMPLYCAAQWISTEGGVRTFDPDEVAFWKPAYEELLAAISSEKVQTIGTQDGEREPVPGFHFADCQVDYPFESQSMDLITSDDLYLRSYPYLDEEHWRGGFDDALMNRRGTRWSRLMVAKKDIRSLWPFDLNGSASTGAPGRPSSMHLIRTCLLVDRTATDDCKLGQPFRGTRHAPG